jgi:NADPH:quinone reductase
MWGGYIQNEPHVLPMVYQELMALFKQGQFKSIAYEHVYEGLEAAPAALEALGARQTWGKVVVRPRRAGAARPKL